jgi:hypothetical protein
VFGRPVESGVHVRLLRLDLVDQGLLVGTVQPRHRLPQEAQVVERVRLAGAGLSAGLAQQLEGEQAQRVQQPEPRDASGVGLPDEQ